MAVFFASMRVKNTAISENSIYRNKVTLPPLVEPHVAMQPPQTWIDRYPQEWDEEHGAYRGQNGYLPHPRPRAAYAAMISDMDEHVGAVLQRLEDCGLTENTIVVFTSDNGPTHGSRDKRFDVGGAGSTFFNSTGGLRGQKGSCYEGGLRVPCIVKWPGKIPAGIQSETPTYFPDWFPTLCDCGDADLPLGQQLDGVNLLPMLQSQAELQRRSPLIWDFHGYGGIVAVRAGKWKAIRRNVLKDQPADWELFDLESDCNETVNLATTHPEIVKRMEAAFLNDRTPELDFPVPLYDLPQR